ncbi:MULTISPECIES: TolC family protein [Dickeya]|uniref:Outer membrane efflux family protein n=2 Tax=Pectobacteriaceae TaxID=1903410 RepID=A0A375A5I1_9GAMM|nr:MULTISPECIES: TolC family protein [Dickeya]SLM61322.1 Outer membrane efflux family protein [Dickeya aquatica]
MINRHSLFLMIFLMLLLTGVAGAELTPSQATRAGASSYNAHPSPAAQRIELTLSDAIYLGLRDNRAIRSAYLDRIAQKFDLRVAEDRFTPKLALSGSYLSARNQSDRYRQGNLTPTSTLLTPYGTRMSLGWTVRHTQADDAGVSRNDGANLSVIQPLLRGAGREAATAPVRLAQLTEQMNRLGLKTTVSQTITQVIIAYRDVLRAQEQVQIAQDALARARQLLEVNRAMIAAGRMAEFEIVQTEADVATQELGYEDAVNQQDTSRLALLQLLALGLNTPIVATDAMQAARIEVDAAQALRQAQTSQPAYLSQLISAEQAQIALAVARNERLWDVSLVGGRTQVSDRSTVSGSTRNWENYVGVQVDIPIGDMSRQQAQTQAQVRVQNQALQLAEARQQLERDVTNAVRAISVRWRQFEIAQRARDLSRRKLEIEREKLTAGRSSNFQVLSFENDLRNAENARLNALMSYLNAQAELDRTLGTTLESWDIALND